MTGEMYCSTRIKNIKEIESFLELDLKYTGEYYSEEINTARLNSGRSGIYHALRMMNCTTLYLPYYLCPDVKDFLKKNSIYIKQYSISDEFEPLLEKNEKESAILIVNYYGLFSQEKPVAINERYINVIFDNCSAFFAKSLDGCYNIYSCQKFFGVPDGCYVIGPEAGSVNYDYISDQSSDTSAFLLMRIEKGCSANYQERMKNEHRIDNSGVLKMSGLTKTLMRSLDYKYIRRKRVENYRYACSIYNPFNLINPDQFTNDYTVPLFYPLVVKDEKLVEKLQAYGIYTGRLWISVLKEVNKNSFESYLSSFIVPFPIDQRYGEKELDYCYNVFRKAESIH